MQINRTNYWTKNSTIAVALPGLIISNLLVVEHSFGNWVRHRRKTLDLTQQELAKRVGCSISLIFKIESDERRPSRQIAELLAECLEIPPDHRPLFLKVARQEKGIQNLESIPNSPTQPLPLITEQFKSNLPLPTTPLIGREHEVAMVVQQLLEPACRLLTLTGPGGVGKTRLALEVAQRLRDEFQQGVYFVPLVGITSADFIFPAIADSLGFAVANVGDVKTQLCHFLNRKNILLVLDNLEHLMDGVQLLCELLASASEIKILTTSREPLNLRPEWTFQVQGLPIPSNISRDNLESNSAAALFMQRARQARLDFSPTDGDLSYIERICQLVEGSPLGLELAAAWVRTLSCPEIAREIETNLDFLMSARRDLPQRHHSMRAVFDYSWHLLSTKEQNVMMRLSVFRGGFTRDAVAQVCGASLAVLSALVDKSLVRYNASNRYDLHELIRQYARGWLIRSGDFEEARNQHFKFFLALVEQGKQKVSGAEQILWLDRLEEDHDNLRAALEWALRTEEADTKASKHRETPAVKEALRLAGELHIFWKRRSHWAEGREWLQRALAQCICLPCTRERLIALNAAALLAVEQADTRSASEYAEQNLTLSQQLGDLRLLATAFNTFGMVRWKQKKYAEARALCEQGLALFRELGDQFGVADSLHSLGHITVNQDDLEAAQSYLKESLFISQALENKIGYVEALGDLGLVAYLKRDYTVAQSYLEESLKLFQEANLLPGVVSALNRLGDLARCQGDYQKAEQLYQQGLSLYREMGDLDEIPSMLHNLGYTAQHTNEPLKALALFREALFIQYKMGNRGGIAECLMGLAGVFAQQGQVKTGARLLGAAEALRVKVGSSLWPANCVECDRILACLKESLDEQAFAAAWNEGQSLTIEQAVAEATR